MRSTRKTAVAVSLLFLIATVTFLIADALITGVLDRPDGVIDGTADAVALTTGALLAFVDGLAVVGIAVFMFPLLRRHNEPLALGYIGLRVSEFAALLLYLMIPLLVITLGEGSLHGTVDAAASQHLGALFQAQYDVAIRMVYLFTSVAGVIFAFMLYRMTLVPRSLALLGVIGYPVLLVGTALDMYGVIDVAEGAGLVAIVPGGLFELALPIWLLAKGFAFSGQD